jgi:hypothetical protein
MLADALSQIYSEDKEGMVRAPSEFTLDEESMSSLLVSLISIPLLVANEAEADVLRIAASGIAPPESGRPETSKEFAQRIKRVRLIVRDEGEQEGEPSS